MFNMVNMAQTARVAPKPETETFLKHKRFFFAVRKRETKEKILVSPKFEDLKVMKKAVLPSMREKKRYLAFEIISIDKFNFIDIKKSITESAKDFLGTLGMAKAGIILLDEKFNKEKQKGLIKVNNKYLNELKASLALIKMINNKKIIVKSLGVSGMLTKADNKYIKEVN